MCRVFLANREGLKELEKRYGVNKFFDYLEKACGGHGNGVAIIKNGIVVSSAKGVDVTNKEIVKLINEVGDYDWVMYHTRVTSKGKTCDEQCHPFINKKGTFALEMNGTETDYGKIGTLLGTSDTDAIFRIYGALDIDVSTLKNLDSRFIGLKNGKIFFTNPKQSGYYSQSLYKLKTKDKNAIVVASEFPDKELPSVKIKGQYYWEEGTTIKLAVKKENKYQFFQEHEWDDYNDNYSYIHPLYMCSKCGSVHEYNGSYVPNKVGKLKFSIGECSCGGKLERYMPQNYSEYIELLSSVVIE